MKRLLASIGIAAALVCGTAAPTLAEGGPITTTTPAPQSGATTPAQSTKRTTPTPDPKTSEKHKLANTGFSALTLGAFAIMLVLFGAGIYSVSRKDN